MTTRTIASPKTFVHFVVESCESGALITRYENNVMCHTRHVACSFDKAIEATNEDLRFFTKNPLTRIHAFTSAMQKAA